MRLKLHPEAMYRRLRLTYFVFSGQSFTNSCFGRARGTIVKPGRSPPVIS